jgi:hypothetical protein
MSKKLQKWSIILFLSVTLIIINSCNNDNTPPVITIIGNNPYIYCISAEPYVDAGATANDDKDGDLTGNINTSSDVNSATEGTYHVTYTVEDKAGNSIIAKREVQVMFCK